MPKLYVISDIHGFYNEMKEALDEAGFDPDNKEHWLISLGDEVDRGNHPLAVISYLQSLERCICVRGNHSDLLLQCIQRSYPLSHDWSNGTAQTIIDLAPEAQTFDEACKISYDKVKDFIYSSVNYFESENYIFVHSWVPLKCNDKLPAHYIRNRKFEFDPDWRNADTDAWYRARWGNPYELAEQGFLPDKTLIFGHFHTSWPRAQYHMEQEFGPNADFSIYYGDRYIAIDACTAYSGKVNVLVLEDNFLE